MNHPNNSLAVNKAIFIVFSCFSYRNETVKLELSSIKMKNNKENNLHLIRLTTSV